MNDRDIENLKMIAIFITAFVSFANFVLNLHEKFLRKPKLIFQIESAKIIEDYLGEIGMQVNVSFRTRNGNLSLKQIDVKNRDKKVNKVSEIGFEIKEYIGEDKVEDSISLSFTFFIHIYGQLDGDSYQRKPLSLDGWQMIVRHSEGELKRIMKAEKIPYFRVKEIIDGIKNYVK